MVAGIDMMAFKRPKIDHMITCCANSVASQIKIREFGMKAVGHGFQGSAAYVWVTAVNNDGRVLRKMGSDCGTAL